jgi:hypothetical protein
MEDGRAHRAMKLNRSLEDNYCFGLAGMKVRSHELISVGHDLAKPPAIFRLGGGDQLARPCAYACMPLDIGLTNDPDSIELAHEQPPTQAVPRTFDARSQHPSPVGFS